MYTRVMKENDEFSPFNIDYSYSHRLGQSETNSMEPKFTEAEKIELQASVEASASDEAILIEKLQAAKELFTKEGLLEYLRDDSKRKLAFEWLNLIVVTLNQIAGNMDSSSIELLRVISANSVAIDEMLKYVYELDQSAGQIDLYNENDSPELQKKRIKFFLSDDVYELIKTIDPKGIQRAINTLKSINDFVATKN